jgi:hypothetical protein
VGYYPVDYKALDAERTRRNQQANNERIARMSGNYDLPDEVLSRLRGVLSTSNRKARRRLHRDAAELNLLAVQDPASGASVRDRLTAAQASAKIAGLMREEVKVSVTHSLGFKGFQGLEGSVIDAVPLPPTSPTVALPALPVDGAKSGG